MKAAANFTQLLKRYWFHTPRCTKQNSNRDRRAVEIGFERSVIHTGSGPVFSPDRCRMGSRYILNRRESHHGSSWNF